MNPNTSTKTWLRVALTLFGVFLSAQAAWILLAERHRLNHIRLPVDGKTATIAFAEQDKIKQAASLAVVRGDLWAESAFTYASRAPALKPALVAAYKSALPQGKAFA